VARCVCGCQTLEPRSFDAPDQDGGGLAVVVVVRRPRSLGELGGETEPAGARDPDDPGKIRSCGCGFEQARDAAFLGEGGEDVVRPHQRPGGDPMLWRQRRGGARGKQ